MKITTENLGKAEFYKIVGKYIIMKSRRSTRRDGSDSYVVRIESKETEINELTGKLVPAEKWEGHYELIGYDYSNSCVIVREGSNLYRDLPVVSSFDAYYWNFITEDGQVLDFSEEG